MTWLLDTMVVSELRKRQPQAALAAWADGQDAQSMFLSSISILEIGTGVAHKVRTDPEQGKRLRAWLEDSLLPAFEGRILPFDAQAARITAGMHVTHPVPERNAMIAGIALAQNLTVVTRNERDFSGLGVEVFNP